MMRIKKIYISSARASVSCYTTDYGKFTFRTEKTELIFQVAENVYERSLVSIFACVRARERSSLERNVMFSM